MRSEKMKDHEDVCKAKEFQDEKLLIDNNIVIEIV